MEIIVYFYNSLPSQAKEFNLEALKMCAGAAQICQEQIWVASLARRAEHRDVRANWTGYRFNDGLVVNLPGVGTCKNAVTK